MSTVMTRRIKQPASVDPARLATALHEKLGAAYWKLSELRQSEQPRLTPNLEPQTIIPHFLTSARGVHSTANTFASSSWRQGEFGIWRKQWEATLSLDELALWDRMQDERDAAEHGDGADLMPIQIPIPPQEGLSRDSTLLLAGLPAHRSESFKGGVRFKSYPDKLASEVCFAYWELCRRFVDDFLRDNAARSEPPPTA
jgi:hypothetical protein